MIFLFPLILPHNKRRIYHPYTHPSSLPPSISGARRGHRTHHLRLLHRGLAPHRQGDSASLRVSEFGRKGGRNGGKERKTRHSTLPSPPLPPSFPPSIFHPVRAGPARCIPLRRGSWPPLTISTCFGEKKEEEENEDKGEDEAEEEEEKKEVGTRSKW